MNIYKHIYTFGIFSVQNVEIFNSFNEWHLENIKPISTKLNVEKLGKYNFYIDSYKKNMTDCFYIFNIYIR